MASVIIPAHNEAAVIEGTLEQLLDGLDTSTVEVIVVCNGCTDQTAQLARGSGVRVVEIDEPSKTGAINAGEAEQQSFPLVVQDADVSVSGRSMMLIIAALAEDGALAAEPHPVFDLSNSTSSVQAFYRVWLGLHGDAPGDVGGGVYAVSELGRRRFGSFPPVIADDAYVRAHFKRAEIVDVPRARSVVRAPATASDLINVRARIRLGGWELRAKYPELWAQKRTDDRSLLKKASSLPLRRWLDVPVYVAIQVAIRVRSARLSRAGPTGRWLRDDSSRRR